MDGSSCELSAEGIQLLAPEPGLRGDRNVKTEPRESRRRSRSIETLRVNYDAKGTRPWRAPPSRPRPRLAFSQVPELPHPPGSFVAGPLTYSTPKLPDPCSLTPALPLRWY